MNKKSDYNFKIIISLNDKEVTEEELIKALQDKFGKLCPNTNKTP